MVKIVAGSKAVRQLAAKNSKRGIFDWMSRSTETPQQREIREWNERVEQQRKDKKS